MYSRKIQLALLALGHGVTDSYGNFLAALSLPLMKRLAFSNTQLGALVSVQSVASSITQIGFGYIADRFGKGIFVVLGPAIAAIFMSLIGLSPNYVTLAVLIFIGGCGVSQFHPQGAASAGRLVQERRGLGISIFTFGGSVGYASGPLIITGIISLFGGNMKATPLAMIWGLVLSLILYFAFYGKPFMSMSAEQRQKQLGLVETVRPHLKVLLLLFAIVVFRAGASTIFVSFLRIFMEDWNLSEVAAGGTISLFLLAGSVGGLIGGTLSDKISRKAIIIFSLCAATPFLWAAVHTSGALFFIFLFLGGFILSSSAPINIVMAQEMMPSNASMASSFMMGLGWGIGGFMAIPFGALSDAVGIDSAMNVLVFIPLFTTVFALMLPGERRMGVKCRVPNGE